MAEKPIIFSGEMVRAILSGAKTMTRRVVKLPDRLLAESNSPVDVDMCLNVSDEWSAFDRNNIEKRWEMIKTPYGKVGDRLWVRETLAADERGMYYFADEALVNVPEDFTQIVKEKLPSMLMPRWASRITLEIDDVRVERLNEISEADAKAEGVDPIGVPIVRGSDGAHLGNQPSFCYGFMALWDKINGKKHPWSENAFVWAIEFRRV